VFLRSQWYVAATSGELARSLLSRRIADEPVVLWRTEQGEPVAFEDRCPHRLAPLSRGRLLGNILECGYHGIRYDATGLCVAVPGQAAPKNAHVRAYRTKELWGYIWLWLGEAGLADETLIPDFHWITEPGWATNGGLMHVKANYQLWIDNLLDLSHVAFVHGGTIGGDATVAETPANVSAEGRQVRVTRWTRDCPAPPTFRKAGGFTGNVDRLQDCLFTPPCYVSIDIRALPAGSKHGTSGIQWRTLHAVVPETATTMHDFWSQSRQFSVDDAEMARVLRGSTTRTLEEDKAMVEAQQEVLQGVTLDSRRISVRADAGATLARRMISEMLDAQRIPERR
jgi:vanillate O-demethylase monooxygenase subunit